MTGAVAQLWRHPIKSHGRERLQRVTLRAGETMPLDRQWAVVHEKSKADGGYWAPCANFSRGSKAPGLQAINVSHDPATGLMTFTHPDLPDLEINPDTEGEKLVAWSAPLIPQDRPPSIRVVRAAERGFTDTDYPTISLINLSSNEALSQHMGMALSPKRWRGNILLDGLAPWEELTWVGKTIRIGAVELEVREPIQRCAATTANPKTGARDADTLGALRALFGHQDFGVYAAVTLGGTLAEGDKIEVVT